MQTHVVPVPGDKCSAGALVVLPEGRGSQEAYVLTDAGPQEHWAPIFSSVKLESGEVQR